MNKGYVLITGVSSGIGYDASKYLIAQGYRVIGSVRKEADAQRLINDFGESYIPLLFDVTDREQVAKGKEKVQSILNGQRLLALVNNAGVAIGGPIELLTDEDFRWQMEVNLFAVRNITNAFLDLLKGSREQKLKGGKIIMISSISGYFNAPYNGAYCVSKHAMESLAELYRRELYMYDIDVVSIQPGPIASKIWEKINSCEEYLDTDYATLCRRANKLIQHSQKNALEPRVISKIIEKIITKRTKTKFVVNKNLWMTLFFTKVIPARWVDKILYKQFFKTKLKS